MQISSLVKIAYSKNLDTGVVTWSAPYPVRIISSDDRVSSRRVKPPASQLIWSMTNYTHYSSERSFEQAIRLMNFYYDRYHTEVGMCSDTLVDANAVYPDYPVLSQNQLISKLRSDCMNVANALGEYKQTAGMFANAASTVYRSYRQAKKGDFSGAAKTLGFQPNSRNAANGWLMWKYGVSPLMGDIYASYRELKKQIDKPLITSASISAMSCINKTVSPSSERFKTIDAYAKVKMTAYVQLDSPVLAWASDHGLTNPLSLAWELTPYSFVVDWFIDVGSFLEALDFTASLTKSALYITRRRRSLVYGFTVGNAGMGTKMLKQGASYGSHRETSRSVGSLGAVAPSYKPALGASRVTSGLALLRQLK